MYRTASLLALRLGIDPSDGSALSAALDSHSIRIEKGRALLDSEDVSALIRTPQVDEAASLASASGGVRRAMVRLQRLFSEGRDLVAEGRDMGTVVFPGACLKVYVVADLATRVVRRLRDLPGGPGGALSFGEVAEGLIRRDRRDRERSDSPLRPAPGACWIDTTLLSVREQVDMVTGLYRAEKGGRRG